MNETKTGEVGREERRKYEVEVGRIEGDGKKGGRKNGRKDESKIETEGGRKIGRNGKREGGREIQKYPVGSFTRCMCSFMETLVFSQLELCLF